MERVSLFPVRCFTCGRVIGGKWDTYVELCEYVTPSEALDRMKCLAVCCRRHFLSHVPELEEHMNRYTSPFIELPIEIPTTIKPTKSMTR